MEAWLSHSLVRYYPTSQAGDRQSLTLDAARGERVSFQVAFRNDDQVRAVSASVDGRSLGAKVRRIGYVPIAHFNAKIPPEFLEGAGHIPGYAPDPLLPDATVEAGPFETNAFWVSVSVPADTTPGTYPVTVALTSNGDRIAQLTAEVVVHQAVLQRRTGFPVTHWFYADALCDWYRLDPFEEAFWPILDRYLANLVSHGQDTIYVPIFTPPLDGIKRPNQLLGVYQSGDGYRFDWKLVRRWVNAAKEQGLKHFEWTHLFLQWGAKGPVRVYEGVGGGDRTLWPEETPPTAPIYRSFLSQFLPEFKVFLEEESILSSSFFHLSDEPESEEAFANYREARQMLREIAPWMKVMDALSDIDLARTKTVDTPIPILRTALDFKAAGMEPWTYFCGGPAGAYLNRKIDTPLPRIRMLGWAFYKTQMRGFLHWGYNYWYKRQTRQLINPYEVTDALAWPGWAYGDPFVVYPGVDGPVDSMRWEIFAEGLQDYALLQAAGVKPDDPMLADIRAFDDAPSGADWIPQARKELLARLDAGS